MRIIGITGTLGAGKGTVVEYLLKNKGFRHFSVRGFITEKIKEKGLPVNRDNMVVVANELRRIHGPAYITDRLYDMAVKDGGDSVIESIRTTGEIESLREKPRFLLLAIDADPEIRYKRIRKRASETDDITYETFLENEKREMDNPDPGKQNLRACMEAADITLTNNGSRQELFDKVENMLKRYSDERKE